MSDSTTGVGIMDVHKENILSISVSGDSGTVMAHWETPIPVRETSPRLKGKQVFIPQIH